jgi:16S rRNA (uracil1498-N3)-methyltransferase
MELFYTRPECISAEEIELDEFERKHILKAVRKSAGDLIFVTDGRGNLYRTRLIKQKPVLRLRIESAENIPAPETQICLAAGFIRPNRLEFILEKCTELGVNRFCLIRSEFSNYAVNNKTRFEKITRQAIKQSQQYYLPKIDIFDSLKDFLLESAEYFHKFAAIDSSHPLLLNKLEDQDMDKNSSSCLVIGPEGGLSLNEAAFLKENNFIPVSLGKNRLRAETAAISGISIILQYLQN